MAEPHIEVMSAWAPNGAIDVATTVNVDNGPLAIPAKLRLGQRGHDGEKIMNYATQVEEYDIWLEDQIKAENMAVMVALDDIYNKAIKSGVIITTICMPTPNITHAHTVRRAIMELAAGAADPEG
jgi:hypothetical protein